MTSQIGKIVRDRIPLTVGQHFHEFRHIALLVRSLAAKLRIDVTRYS
jgi:hypothetical protein